MKNLKSNPQTKKLTNEECKEVKKMKKVNMRMVTVFIIIWTLMIIIGGENSEAGLGVNVDTSSLEVNTKAGEPIQNLAPITVTNTAGYKETLRIKIANEGSYWHRGDNPGTDQYVLKFKEGTNPLEHLTTTNQLYKQSETGGGESTLTLALQPPSDTTSSSNDDLVVNLSSWPEDGYAYNQAGDFFYKIVAFDPYTDHDVSSPGQDHLITETQAWSLSVPLLPFIASTCVNVDDTSYCYSTNLATDAVWVLPYLTTLSASGWTGSGTQVQWVTNWSSTYGRGRYLSNLSIETWVLTASLYSKQRFYDSTLSYQTYWRGWLLILD